MMKYMTSAFYAAVMAGLAALPQPATAEDLKPLRIILNSPAAGYNSGFELAVVNGYYKQLGLDVTLEPGNGSGIAAQLVATGQFDMAYADAAAVMALIKDGAKITIVATILQSNPNQVTALESSGIKKLTDIKGKRVAIPNGYSQAAMFPLVLKHIGLTDKDITLVNMPAEAMVPSLLQGTVDVILGSIDNFGVLLKKQGSKTVDFLFSDYGAPTVSTGIIAGSDFLKKNPDVVKAFIAGSLKGWSAAIDDNKAALAAMSKLFPDAKADLAQGQLDATQVLMCANGAKFVGKATDEEWKNSVTILSEIGVIPANKLASDYYSYDLLPKESELRTCPLKKS
jgi:NitT/TauT family transport system substrate-binding protein